MKKNSGWPHLLMAAMGVLLVYCGGVVLATEKLKMISGMCIGFGSAAACLGIGRFVGTLTVSKSEDGELTRKKNIEVNDERNIRIREKVGAAVNRVVIYVLTAIIFAMGFMGISIVAICMVASVLLLELVLAIVLSNYYSKRM